MSLSSWDVTLQFSIVYSLFALSFYAPLSAGVLSVASMSSGAIGGFLFAGLAPASTLNAVLLLLGGALAGGVFALITAFVLLRLSSHYLAMGTIALLLVTNVVILNATSLTGGVDGRIAPQSFGWTALIVTLVICCWAFARLRGSRLGLAAAVIREDPLAGSAIGINPREIQRLVFTIGGAVAGAAGVLLASLLSYIDPTTFYLPLAFTSLAAVVLGGAFYWQGAIVGGIVFTLLPQLLNSYLPPNYDQVVDGLLIVAFVLFLPGGLWDARRLVLKLRARHATAGDLPEQLPEVTVTEVLNPSSGAQADQSSDPALEVLALTRIFDGLHAVDDLSVSVPRGSIFGILGPNGAGKTTMINLVSGVFPPTEGQIRILGEDVTGWPSHRIARLGLARTYQNIRLSPGLTTLECIMSGAYSQRSSNIVSVLAALPGERRERHATAQEARELTDVVGITTPPGRLAQTLSYGEQRRVEIARALASHPKVLLLDEPTAGMNARESAALGDLMRELVARGLTVVLVEHNIRLVSEYCDFAVVMNSGIKLAEGTPAECLAREDVQTAYFGRKADAERIQALRLIRVDTGG